MTTEAWPEINCRRLEAVFRSDAYLNGLGARLLEWDGGRAVYRLAPESHHLNFVGSVHGGVLFSVADAALAVASNSWGRVGVALSVETQFLEASAGGEALVATALERSRTRRTAAYGIDVVSEEDGSLRACFQAMAFPTGRWHLGEDTWPDEWRATH